MTVFGGMKAGAGDGALEVANGGDGGADDDAVVDLPALGLVLEVGALDKGGEAERFAGRVRVVLAEGPPSTIARPVRLARQLVDEGDRVLGAEDLRVAHIVKEDGDVPVSWTAPPPLCRRAYCCLRASLGSSTCRRPPAWSHCIYRSAPVAAPALAVRTEKRTPARGRLGATTTRQSSTPLDSLCRLHCVRLAYA